MRRDGDQPRVALGADLARCLDGRRTCADSGTRSEPAQVVEDVTRAAFGLAGASTASQYPDAPVPVRRLLVRVWRPVRRIAAWRLLHVLTEHR